ncbi:myo-inosose-2 dehydratase [Halomonas dongshanensis]|uniref:Myo-inosose-2 dehydratase n=1 Tax=Halomonas dongshanensis TaxID=2890835 RepID=A0ABT2E9G5_9GAMM|nr:myo-inosose-2 dehydratase [Halomonas dongshanensis]MCS2608154.1 myo-inosose-2 dehydratase [Halomonas dongshanensis]
MANNIADLLAPHQLRLGINPLSWTNDVIEEFGDDTPVETFLREAAECGYQGVEMGRKFPRQAAALKPLLAEYDLALVSGWYSGFLAERDVETELDEVAAHADLLATCGAKVMVYGECGLMPGTAPLDAPLSKTPVVAAADWRAYGERLTRFSETLKARHGIALAYHAHLMMVVESGDEIDALMANTGDAVGLLFDAGHVVAGGGDLKTLLARHGSRINHLHFKDIRRDVMAEVRRGDLSFNQGVRNGMFTVPGDGYLDFTPLVDFATQTDYQGWLVVEAEQDPRKAPPKEMASIAYRHVHSLFAHR